MCRAFTPVFIGTCLIFRFLSNSTIVCVGVVDNLVETAEQLNFGRTLQTSNISNTACRARHPLCRLEFSRVDAAHVARSERAWEIIAVHLGTGGGSGNVDQLK